MSAGTPRHTIRVDNELWQAFRERAEERHEDASAVLRRYMKRYLSKTADLPIVDPNSSAAEHARRLSQ